MASSILTRLRLGENTWERQQDESSAYVGCFALEGERLVETRVKGSQSNGIPNGTLQLRTVSGSRRQRLLEAGELPNSPNILKFQDGDLWVGGLGYIALVDVTENKIKKFAYITASVVDQIQIGGGYLWVQFDKHLYRAALRTLR